MDFSQEKSDTKYVPNLPLPDEDGGLSNSAKRVVAVIEDNFYEDQRIRVIERNIILSRRAKRFKEFKLTFSADQNTFIIEPLDYLESFFIFLSFIIFVSNSIFHYLFITHLHHFLLQFDKYEQIRINLSFSFALIFWILILSFIISNVFSFYMYSTDEIPTSWHVWILRGLFHILLLGPFYRHCEVIFRGVRLNFMLKKYSFKEEIVQKTFENFEIQRVNMVYILTLLNFLQNATIFTFQIFFCYIMDLNLYPIMNNFDKKSFIFIYFILPSSTILTIFTFGFGNVNYERIVLVMRFKKGIRFLQIFSIIIQLIWHTTTFGSRILSVVLGVSSSPGITMGIITFHIFIMMLINKFIQNRGPFFTKEEKHSGFAGSIIECLYEVTTSLIQALCPFRFVDGTRSIKPSLFYAISFVEDFIFLNIWYYGKLRRKNDTLLKNYAPFIYENTRFLYTILFFFGTLAMAFYYRKLKSQTTPENNYPKRPNESDYEVTMDKIIGSDEDVSN